jgi:hypothetical protein
MEQNHERRRGHFRRGRRGPERRGGQTRGAQAPEQEPRGRDHVDVEQIMRDIRARIAQQHGIDLSDQQIQELAARRLESILDPRAIKPALLDELRRSAGVPDRAPARAIEPPFRFEDSTLYETHHGILRFLRRLLNPLLKLFFNPNPLIQSLNIQARLNVEAAERDAARDRRQTEWNALHFEILQRLVTEVSRVSLELQAQSMRIESLSAKTDFNDHRVRSMEGIVHQPRPAGRMTESTVVSAPTATEGVPGEVTEGVQTEGTKRRRRRRRGRRSGGAPGDAAVAGAAQPSVESDADADIDEGALVAPVGRSPVTPGEGAEDTTDPPAPLAPQAASIDGHPAPPANPAPEEGPAPLPPPAADVPDPDREP